MVVEILLIVDLFLWFLTLVPVPQAAPYSSARPWLAWIAVFLITLHLFVPSV